VLTLGLFQPLKVTLKPDLPIADKKQQPAWFGPLSNGRSFISAAGLIRSSLTTRNLGNGRLRTIPAAHRTVTAQFRPALNLKSAMIYRGWFTGR